MVGGLLVAAAAVGLFAAYTRAESGPHTSYVVARRAVAAGARLEAADLVRRPMQLPADLQRRAFSDAGALVGATVIAPLAAGELVQASSVVAKESQPSDRELSFAVERATLSPGLEAGERVDVLATFGTGVEAFTTTVLHHALVVGLDRSRGSLGERGSAFVTVALSDPHDALAMAHAVQLGKLTVVRATGATPLTGDLRTYRQPSQSPDGR